MSELLSDDVRTLIAYPEQKFAEEDYQFPPAQRPMRQAGAASRSAAAEDACTEHRAAEKAEALRLRSWPAKSVAM